MVVISGKSLHGPMAALHAAEANILPPQVAKPCDVDLPARYWLRRA
jgi:hypothetical protein